ncbi:AtpZ/AtpI family protein [Pseudotenacibaculum sp. MALMAid0570]|uniref:AtpZ/AtpI family protein n=1 Tax=Pseudotenacibaculum sp. MALMAid0570 TaxID=3143938 RepID=UPI0032DE5A22
MSNKKEPSQKKQLKNFASFFGIGVEMGVIIFLSNLLGQYLDTKFQKSYLENLVTLIGVFLAMSLIIYRVNRFNKK